MGPRQTTPPVQGKNASDAGNPTAISRPYLTVEELSALTTLSVSTLRRLYKRGLIVGFQPGGPRTRIVFPSDALEQLARTMAGTAIPTPCNPSESTKTPQRGPRPKWLDASGAGMS
jgi:hypothetical protein